MANHASFSISRARLLFSSISSLMFLDDVKLSANVSCQFLVVKNCILIRKYDSVSNDIYMLTWRGFFWLHNFSQGLEFSFVILEKKNHAKQSRRNPFLSLFMTQSIRKICAQLCYFQFAAENILLHAFQLQMFNSRSQVRTETIIRWFCQASSYLDDHVKWRSSFQLGT